MSRGEAPRGTTFSSEGMKLNVTCDKSVRSVLYGKNAHIQINTSQENGKWSSSRSSIKMKAM